MSTDNLRSDEYVGRNQDRQEFKIVGRRDIRIPGAMSYVLVTGAAKFSADVIPPNLLHGKILRSPYAHARVKRIDTSKAERLPGVKAVLTFEDEEVKTLPLLTRETTPTTEPPRLFSFQHFQDNGVFVLGNEANREGEEVGACVAAETEEICDEAIKLLEIEWEVLPHAIDPKAALEPEAPIVYPERDPVTNCASEYRYHEGNVDEAFEKADHILEFDHYYGYVFNHKPNPYTIVAWWEQDPMGTEGKSLFVAGSAPFQHFKQIRRAFNLTEDKIRWLNIFDGSEYCLMIPRRSGILAPLLAKRTGRPMRIAHTRRDSFENGGGSENYSHLKIGFTNDGILTAAQSQAVTNSGMAARKATDKNTIARATGMPELDSVRTTKCTNIKEDARNVYTNTVRKVAYSWGGGWTISEILWRIADSLGMDPTEVALKNCHTPEPSLKLCIERGKAAIGWDEKWHAPGTRKLANGKMHGMAFKYQNNARHSGMIYSVSLDLKSDGKVYVPVRGPLRGTYCEDACALVIAEELGARPEDIVIQWDPRGQNTCMGGGVDAGGGATWVAKEAALDLKEAILRNAVALIKQYNAVSVTHPDLRKGIKPEDLDIKNSRIYLKANPDINFNMGVVADDFGHGWIRDVTATYTGRPPYSSLMAYLYNQTPPHRFLDTMNSTFCEVEVDTETGELDIIKWVVAHDVGKAIRISSIEGQIEQQCVIFTGVARTEEFIWDKKTGVLLNGNDLEYKIPTILDVGDIESVTLETRVGNGCYGATGVYHSVIDPTLINLAVQNAINKWVYGVPITPDRVLKALGKI